MRQTRMNERHVNRRNIMENDMKTLFNYPMHIYINIRNPLNDKFEKEQVQKNIEEKKTFMNL
jgi:predicted pyridoxine 5'-phosphate oxidase superfamily flavin-nucleotide-binding protein